MTGMPPPDSPRLYFIGHLKELRQRIVVILIFFTAMCAVLFAQGYQLMAWLEAPAGRYVQGFIFIDPTEAFAAYFKVVLLAAGFVSFPVFLYQLWAFLLPALSRSSRHAVLGWILGSIVFFYGGIIFSYLILLPAAINFLLGFGEGIARPAITISRYISFAGTILLMGGVIFQIPVVLGLLTEAGVLKAAWLSAGRKYAILILVIMAALISPTSDIFNLLLFAVPMIVLYEAGVLLSWIIERRKSHDR